KGDGIFAFDESYVGKELVCGIENSLFPILFFRYYVTMKSREDVANRPLPDVSSAASVYADQGFVHVVAKAPADVAVYALSGVRVYYGKAGEGRTDIPLKRGMYIVTVGGKTCYKVVVR
ncbi:MAG: T9SS type A sorting domain-containing protein, partial [Tannerella sp.]|nr:T9SS type A sorting domain-containing protein [Tannerella sp.]